MARHDIVGLLPGMFYPRASPAPPPWRDSIARCAR
jgi:hypothetical protein